MKYENIGSRLKMAASLVCNGKTVCDVGCDHGKLSLYLIKSGRAEKIIATDVNKMPLQKAISLFKDYGLSDCATFYLTDGLTDVKDTKEISHVVIAGLGGETISQIIHQAEFIKQKKVKLVLVPAQGASRIREYLYTNGFSILQEIVVKDKRKFYTVIESIHTNTKINPTVYDCYIGKSDECDATERFGYYAMVLSQLEKKKKGKLIDTGNCDKDICDAIEKINLLLKQEDK